MRDDCDGNGGCSDGDVGVDVDGDGDEDKYEDEATENKNMYTVYRRYDKQINDISFSSYHLTFGNETNCISFFRCFVIKLSLYMLFFVPLCLSIVY